MLNYANLNDVEFEYLCQDIMQKKLNAELHRFAKGRDGGVDLTDNVYTKNIVVQVKYYVKSSVSNLIDALKKETEKVAQLSPKEYYVCCSKELSPNNVNDIYQLFSKYMQTPSNVITLTEIESFLCDPANIEVLKKHYKLWIESTGILQEIGNTSVFVDCEALLANIENEKKLFVKTSAFSTAVKCLQEERILFITGNPGVGKTITSKMIVLHYAANGYRVRFSTSVSNLAELKQSLSRNPETKEIILVDDCFGQAYYNMKESQNDELLSLIYFVSASTNKLLVLNSRITILQEAKERKPELLKCFEGNHFRVYVLDMSALDDVEKAKIFYNHISFNGMDKDYFSEIKKGKRYINIIRHANYTPRIIEFVCSPNRYKSIPSSQYYDYVMQQLNNPKEIWKDEYERRLKKVDRLLLLTVYSLSDSAVDENLVKNCFERRLCLEKDIDTTINQYEASLARLLDGFVRIVSFRSEKRIAMVNPSINDYIDGRLIASPYEREQLIAHASAIQQKKRLMTESEFETFAQTALKNREIDRYLFDSKRQKEAFIAYYCCKYNILDDVYIEYIQAFLNAPYYLRIYGVDSVAPIKTVRQIFRKDICHFYKIREYLGENFNLDNMLDSFVLEEMVELICLIDQFFTGDRRESFVNTASEQLQYAIQAYCDNLDVDDYSPDIDYALESARYDNGLYEGIDIEKAASYIYDEIISDAISEIDDLLSMLPEDIEYHCNYTEGLSFSVDGVNQLVKSYLADDYDYADFEEKHFRGDDHYDEIDYIFDRD